MFDLCGQLSCTASTPVFLACGYKHDLKHEINVLAQDILDDDFTTLEVRKSSKDKISIPKLSTTLVVRIPNAKLMEKTDYGAFTMNTGHFVSY